MEDFGIFKDVDMTNMPRLRNSLSNEGCGPLSLPTQSEMSQQEMSQQEMSQQEMSQQEMEYIETNHGTFEIDFNDYPHVKALLSDEKGEKYPPMDPRDLA